MKHTITNLTFFIPLIFFPLIAISAEPVPVDCDPSRNCKPIDPCDINPQRQGCPDYKEPSVPTNPPPPLNSGDSKSTSPSKNDD